TRVDEDARNPYKRAIVGEVNAEPHEPDRRRSGAIFAGPQASDAVPRSRRGLRLARRKFWRAIRGSNRDLTPGSRCGRSLKVGHHAFSLDSASPSGEPTC